MGKKKLKTSKFLDQHPVCCFCGGLTSAETMDHIPPRSFFLDGKHPNGMEFPACKNCNNQTSNAEDIARLLSKVQGASFSSELQTDFFKRQEKYQRTARQFRIQIENTGQNIDGIEMFKLGKKEEESFNLLSHKVILGLYYKIMKKIVNPSQRVSLIFYTPEKNRENALKVIKQMPGTSLDASFSDTKIAQQFYYRFINYPEMFGQSNSDGWDLLIGFHFLFYLFDKDREEDWFIAIIT